MKIVLFFVIIALLVLLFRPGFGFRTQKPSHYADTGPQFDMVVHLNGPIVSEGMIHDFRGRMVSRFVAQMRGTWDGDTGSLTENFTYANGNSQMREWVLTLGDNGSFSATAEDIIGMARGQVSGATLSMTYRIRLPETAGGHVLDVTDWLYLMDNGTILNRSELRKFGIKVGELTATMRREGS